MESIQDVRQRLFVTDLFHEAEFIKGATCPCCDQFVKATRRKIHGRIARTLILMSKEVAGNSITDLEGYIDIKALWRKYGMEIVTDYAIAKFWGLVELKDSVRDDGSKRVGKWKLTETGRQFVYGKPIRKYAYVYNNKCLNFSSDEITIRECLGKAFNYEEMMTIDNK